MRLRQAAIFGGFMIALAAIVASGPAQAIETSHHHHHRHVHHPHHTMKPHGAAKHKAHPHAPPPHPHASTSTGHAHSPGPSTPAAAPVVGAGGGGGGGGGGGAGSGGAGWSDRRLKRDIRRIGTSPSGLAIYAFRYVWGGPTFVGVIAQDLLESRPDAVIETDSGYYMVDYGKIDVTIMTLEDYLALQPV